MKMVTETISMTRNALRLLPGTKLVGSHASDSKMNVKVDTRMVAITTIEISFARLLKAGF